MSAATETTRLESAVFVIKDNTAYDMEGNYVFDVVKGPYWPFEPPELVRNESRVAEKIDVRHFESIAIAHSANDKWRLGRDLTGGIVEVVLSPYPS